MLARKVGTLSSEFAQIKELLLNLQPDDRGSAPSGDSVTRRSPCRDIDVLSTAASCSLFDDEGDGQDEDKDSVSRAGPGSGPKAEGVFTIWSHPPARPGAQLRSSHYSGHSASFWGLVLLASFSGAKRTGPQWSPPQRL